MLVSRCQMECPYCAVNRDQPDMPETVLRRSVDLLFTSSWNRVELQFFGGEPLLRWDLVKKGIAYAEKKKGKTKKDVRYLLTTNGLLLDERKAAFLKGYPVTVMVSLDGNKKTQRKNRPLAGSGPYPSGLLEKNLKNLIRAGIDYFVNLTFLPENLPGLQAGIRYLMKAGVRNIQLSYAIGATWGAAPIRAFLGALRRALKMPGFRLVNPLEESEPILGSPQILVTSAGRIYLGCAAVLERSFPLLNEAFYFNDLARVKDIRMLERGKGEQLKLLGRFSRACPPRYKKMIESNLKFGRLLSGFK